MEQHRPNPYVNDYCKLSAAGEELATDFKKALVELLSDRNTEKLSSTGILNVGSALHAVVKAAISDAITAKKYKG